MISEEHAGIKNPQQNYASTSSVIHTIFVLGIFASAILVIFYPATRKYLIETSILLGILLIISAIAIFVDTFYLDKDKKSKTKQEKTKYISIFIVLMAELLFGIQSLMLGILYVLYNIFLLAIKSGFFEDFRVAIVTSIIFIFGCFFYYLRLKFRALYGAFEVLFSLLVIVHFISEYFDRKMQTSNFMIGIATAGIYIIVRGMDNIQAALIDPEKDMWISKLPLKLIKGLKVVFMVEKNK